MKASQLLADIELAASRYSNNQADRNAYEIGCLRATVRSLCAEAAIRNAEPTTASVERLIGEAQGLVGTWLDHPIAGSNAASVHDSLSDALGHMRDVRFYADDELEAA